MSTKSIDVYIYMTHKGKTAYFDDFVSDISCLAGVTKACINTKVKHLVEVKYNPDNISVGAMLYIARKNGVTASLVGM